MSMDIEDFLIDVEPDILVEEEDDDDDIPDRLIPKFQKFDQNNITYEILTIAGSIEDALLLSGAIPGTDYDYVDLISLAIKYRNSPNIRNNMFIGFSECNIILFRFN